MLAFPNCKINIGLQIISKRSDGYHNIATVFLPVYGLSDVIEVKKEIVFVLKAVELLPILRLKIIFAFVLIIYYKGLSIAAYTIVFI